MSRAVLILGGTAEAAALAHELVRDHPDWRVITSLAGRTLSPDPLPGEVRIGGFGGPDGLAAYLRAEHIDQLIDATHPFARQISSNAKHAAEASGVPLTVHIRPPWEKQPADNWIEVANETEAAAALATNANIFLALGRQHLAPFASRNDVAFLVRMVDTPADAFPLGRYDVITGKPGNAEDEAVLFEHHKIDQIVCRNAGGARGYGKIEAARKLGLPVIMIGRPNP